MTILILGDAMSLDDSRLAAPPNGWDYSEDIEEGKAFCRAARFGISRGKSKGAQDVANIAMRLRDYGVSCATAIKLVMEFGEPLLPEEIVIDAVENYYRYAATAPGLLSKANGAQSRWRAAVIEEEESENAWMDAAAHSPVWPKPIQYEPKRNSAQLAEQFLLDRPGDLIVSDGVIYTLEPNKIWSVLPEEELAAEIRATDPTLRLDTHQIFRMIAAIKMDRFTRARPFEWIESPVDEPEPRDLILFRNGVLDFKRDRLIPHTGQYFATGTPEFDYDPDATCPTWDRCLDEWLDPSFHDTLHEWFGYSMTPDTSLHKFLAMFGVRRGGKSTVLAVNRWLVGAAHVISRTLNDLGGEFGLEGCLDSKLMAIPDAHDTELTKRSVALDRLKTITGNDQVSVNRENLKIVSGTVPTRICLAANRHPKFIDESGALAARELILVFGRSFEAAPDYDLGDKLRAELPGIANRALDGLFRLRENGGFTIGEKGKAAARELAASQSPALRFAQAHLIVTGDAEDCAPLTPTYEHYRHWALELEHLAGRELRNRDDFRADLEAALMNRGVTYTRRRWHDPKKERTGRGELMRGFWGAKLRA